MATPPTGRPKGRPPKTRAQKASEGNRGKRKLPEPIDTFEERDGIPNNPGLGEDGARMWAKIWEAGVWLNIDADHYAVLTACRNFEEFELLRRERDLGIFPRSYRTAAGVWQTHPKINQLAAAERNMILALSDIGFTPAGRARLETAVMQEEDPMEKMKELEAKHKAETMELISNLKKVLDNE